jgi:hypothetical protein
MIVIAVLAMLIAAVRILAVRSGYRLAAVRIEGSNVRIVYERLGTIPGDILDFPPNVAPHHGYFVFDEYVSIPAQNIAILAIGIVAILALGYRYRSKRRRWLLALGCPDAGDYPKACAKPE